MSSPVPMIERMRHPVSGLMHLMGVALAILALVVLVQGTLPLTGWHVAGAAVFGATMVLLYGASSLYHLTPVVDPRAVDRLRQLDHAAIYVFIAGCYTPICLVTLRGGLGTGLLALVWTLALAGVAAKLLRPRLVRSVTVSLYLGLGWLALPVLPALWAALPGSGVAWLVAGGLAYTVGAGVYLKRRPDPFPRWLGHHEIWHVFVMAGTFCHFRLVQTYVLPA